MNRAGRISTTKVVGTRVCSLVRWTPFQKILRHQTFVGGLAERFFELPRTWDVFFISKLCSHVRGRCFLFQISPPTRVGGDFLFRISAPTFVGDDFSFKFVLPRTWEAIFIRNFTTFSRGRRGESGVCAFFPKMGHSMFLDRSGAACGEARVVQGGVRQFTFAALMQKGAPGKSNAPPHSNSAFPCGPPFLASAWFGHQVLTC